MTKERDKIVLCTVCVSVLEQLVMDSANSGIYCCTVSVWKKKYPSKSEHLRVLNFAIFQGNPTTSHKDAGNFFSRSCVIYHTTSVAWEIGKFNEHF